MDRNIGLYNADQTAPVETVSSGSTLFAHTLTLVKNVIQICIADNLSSQHFQMHFCRHFEGKHLSCNIMDSKNVIYEQWSIYEQV